MGAGKIIAIIGGVLGILSVVLFFALPEIFSFWQLSGGGGGMYLGGFGHWDGTAGLVYAEDTLLTIIFVLIIAGGAIAIVGGLIENKVAGALGGLLMIVGPILFIVALVMELGDFELLAALISGIGGDTLLFGSAAGVNWGLWISTFLALGGGVLGLIGGLKVED